MRPKNIILKVWLVAVGVSALSLMLWPHMETTVGNFFVYALQLLLMLISAAIAWNEPNRKNKCIFWNFAAFFAIAIPTHLYNFVGTVFFADEKFARLYALQYVFFGLSYFLLCFALAYLAIDVLFRDFRTYQKYIIVLAIVGGFFGYYHHNFLADARYAYDTPDVKDWKTLNAEYESFQNEHGIPPTPEELASLTNLPSWGGNREIGILFPAERLARVEALYPYLPENYLVLVYKPIFQSCMSMCVVCIGFVLLFFGYTYMKDPPQGAYIEKIMFLFLLFSTLEVLHAWTQIKTIEWSAADSIWSIGQYVSTAILVLITAAFALRLRFITSVKGEFYEQELAFSPRAVTRWRDAIDNIVIEKFFNRKLVLGRLFAASPTQK